MRFINIIVTSLVFTSFTACQTTPTHFEIFHIGQWDAKAIIRDAATQKSQLVNLDIIAQRESNLRIEVTSPSGFQLASFSLNETAMSVLLPRDHEYLTGPVSTAGFQKLIGVTQNRK